MVKIIMGPKGTGKTKSLVELVKKASQEESGSVICIEKDRNLTYDIPHTARLIHAGEYSFGTVEYFLGFINGLHAGNYDISHVFIDNFFKLFDELDFDGMAKILDVLDEFGKRESIKFTITVTADPATVGDNIKKYL